MDFKFKLLILDKTKYLSINENKKLLVIHLNEFNHEFLIYGAKI